jgi:hypothetical protein
VHLLGHFGHASFKLPSEAHPSLTKNRGSGVHLGPTALVSRRSTVADVRDRDRSLSLSSGYKNPRRWKVSPFHSFFLTTEVLQPILEFIWRIYSPHSCSPFATVCTIIGQVFRPPPHLPPPISARC